MKEDLKTETNFNVGDLLPIGLTILILGIALAYGLDVMSDVQTDLVVKSTGCGLNSTGGTGNTLLYYNCSGAYNASGDAITGVAKIPEKLPMIVTVVVAAVIIGIIVVYLGRRMM